MKKLLIANRGEIACRIIRTARQMGIRTVAVYSQADAGALHTQLADEAYPIGSAPAVDSYLRIENILQAARQSGADAIHPGYGFLSENADFADMVRSAGLIFVGPSSQAMRVMGLKDSAKAAIKAAGVPIVPGYMGDDQSLPRLERMAQTIGYPCLIKAVAGGGGKGMRPVADSDGFTEALLSAQREAMAAFGHDGVMLEKLIQRPRHVEVQIFGDQHGNIVHLFERDCSLQRRHQKLIEEAPAPGLSDHLRHVLGVAAITAGHAIQYENAGTVEFILDMDDLDDAGDPAFYFMEMNTRLQVEHPVTEQITGLDLVEWQLRVARGEMLPLMQEAIECHGHAIEARLYAENPEDDFLPSAGTITALEWPSQVRIDTGISVGSSVGTHYDPMLAKIISHAPTRSAAIDQLVSALDHLRIEGLHSNRAFLARLLSQPQFGTADIDTGLIARHHDTLFPNKPAPPQVLAKIANHILPAPMSQAGFQDIFRVNLPAAQYGAVWDSQGQPLPFTRNHQGICVNGTPIVPDGLVVVLPTHDGYEARKRGENWRFYRENPLWNAPPATSASNGQILSPMPGRLLSLDVQLGDQVSTGDTLAVLEAMKMEHRLTAPIAGRVTHIALEPGSQLAEGMLILHITAD